MKKEKNISRNSLSKIDYEKLNKRLTTIMRNIKKKKIKDQQIYSSIKIETGIMNLI